jgi:hypothetical protein
MKNVLFFSDRCRHSAEFMKAIQNAPFRKEICYINVDTKRDDNLLSILEVDRVPTLFVNGRMMVGDQVFHWLEDALGATQPPSRPAAPAFAPRAPPTREHLPPPPPQDDDADVFDPQPMNGDGGGSSYYDFTQGADDAPPRMPAPVHSRKNDKLDDGNMAQMLRKLEEDRRSGVPLSLEEQKAMMSRG